jgi:hypothetical protein
MKTLVSGRKFHLTVAGIFLASLNTFAQMPGGDAAGMTSALTKLFGDINTFTAKAEVQVLDTSDKEIAVMPMDFSLLDKKIRVEMDLTQVKNTSMPPGAATTLKQMGMAQVISLIRPDKKLVYVVYPDQRMMMTMPLPDDGSESAGKSSKPAKIALGKETVDGHPCVKNKVVINDVKGDSVEATTWNATDLKDFPVQIQTKEKENTSFIRFKHIQLERQDAKHFEPPTGYTEYKDQMELMQAVMKKMTEGKK